MTTTTTMTVAITTVTMVKMGMMTAMRVTAIMAITMAKKPTLIRVKPTTVTGTRSTVDNHDNNDIYNDMIVDEIRQK